MAQKKNTFTDVCFAVLDTVKRVLCFLDRIIIGVCLKWIVNNYDKRHGIEPKSSNETKTSDNTIDVNTLQTELSDTLHKLELMSTEKQNLERRFQDKCEELDYTRKELEDLARTSDLFADSIADLKETIKSLTVEKLQRLTTEKQINRPQQTQDMFITELYAEPDATGAILRKISNSVTKYSLYKLTLSSPDDLICKFSVLNNEATSMYIDNREMALQACQILEISSNPNSFETIEPGTAVKENSNWVVTSQAKIKII